MKHILLTCCIAAITLGHAAAQVHKGSFITLIIELDKFIKLKDQPGQTDTYSQLTQLMNTQIIYFTACVSSSSATYTTDTTKIRVDSKAANNPHPANVAQAQAQMVQAALNSMNQYKQLLQNDTALYNDITSLSSRIAVNRAAIIADLNQFALTLNN